MLNEEFSKIDADTRGIDADRCGIVAEWLLIM